MEHASAGDSHSAGKFMYKSKIYGCLRVCLFLYTVGPESGQPRFRPRSED